MGLNIPPIAVRIISHNGVTNIGTVHSDLMSPASYGPQQYLSCRIRIIDSPLQHQHAGVRRSRGHTMRVSGCAHSVIVVPSALVFSYGLAHIHDLLCHMST